MGLKEGEEKGKTPFYMRLSGTRKDEQRVREVLNNRQKAKQEKLDAENLKLVEESTDRGVITPQIEKRLKKYYGQPHN